MLTLFHPALTENIFLLTGNWPKAESFFSDAHTNAVFLPTSFDCISLAFRMAPWLFLMLLIMSFSYVWFFSCVCILYFLLLNTLFHTDGTHSRACQPDSLSRSSLKIISLSISWSRFLPYALWCKEHIWFLSTKSSFLQLVNHFQGWKSDMIHSSLKRQNMQNINQSSSHNPGASIKDLYSPHTFFQIGLRQVYWKCLSSTMLSPLWGPQFPLIACSWTLAAIIFQPNSEIFDQKLLQIPGPWLICI